MSKQCKLIVLDQVNIKIDDVDPATRRKLVDAVKYVLPYARHTPAFRLGRWDGTVKYCDVGGRTYLNVLDKLYPILINAGYQVEVDDRRTDTELEFEAVDENSYSHVTWPNGHSIAGQPIKLRDYQVEYINTFLSSPQGIGVASTGAGKTLCTAVLSHKIQKYGRSIVIVPSKDLVTQTEEDYINLGLDVGVYFGDRKEFGKTHTICTWQSLDVLNKKSKYYDPEFSFEDFIDGVAGVIVDEVHKVSADVLHKLLTREFANVPIRWGLTGTIPKEIHQEIGLITAIGPVLGRITAKELQDKGVLSNLHINVLQYQDYGDAFTSYQSELKWLTTNDRRLKAIAQKISDASKEGNTLVLVDRIETGKTLEKLIPNSVFLSGADKSSERKEEYEEIKFTDDKVLICTFGIASTGLNLVRIYNLFLFEPGKSFVRVIQSIGRGIRKSSDKTFLNVYDICSNTKYSKKHLTERKKYYKESEYPFTITKVDYD